VTGLQPLLTVTGIEAYNTSRLNLRAILADPPNVAANLRAQIGRLDRAKLRRQDGAQSVSFGCASSTFVTHTTLSVRSGQ
jgi:hypothetical protein